MSRALRLIAVLLAMICFTAAFGQSPPYSWSAEISPKESRAGEAAQIIVTLKLDEGWHAYQIGQEGGPLGIEIKLLDGPLEAIDNVVVPTPARKFDNAFKIEVGYYEKLAKFAIPVRLKEGKTGAQIAKVEVKSQVCNAQGCDRPRTEELEIKYTVEPGETRVDRIAIVDRIPDQPAQPTSKETSSETTVETEPPPEAPKSLWGIFVAGFLGGLLALITPCVFPMIPVTISFFSKQGDDRKAHLRAALLYCLGIVVSFTGLGLLVTILLGKNGTYILANNLWVNGALFILFVVLALSLFGVLELILPSGFLTKITGATQRGGTIAAPLLMGLTFALTSFTCTVPVVAGLLASAATGDRIYPATGMIGFSVALALPFLLLAMFPSLMKKLPKSGGWMVTAKAFMGFLELAAGLKFLSNIDLVLKLGILTRPVFLAVWATIFILAGIHLFGWIKLPHDATSAIGPVRRIIGVASIAAAYFCLAGLNGGSLGVASGLLPPSDYQYKDGRKSVENTNLVPWILNDYPAALAESKSSGKPLLIDFTGIT